MKGYNAAKAGGSAKGSGSIGSFHMLHATCLSRIHYKKICPIHGEVANEDIVSGYEFAKGEYVTVAANEKSKLREEDDKAIAIDTFVEPAAIDHRQVPDMGVFHERDGFFPAGVG